MTVEICLELVSELCQIQVVLYRNIPQTACGKQKATEEQMATWRPGQCGSWRRRPDTGEIP